MNDVECYGWELKMAVENGLTAPEIAELQARRQESYNKLSDPSKALVNKGDYQLAPGQHEVDLKSPKIEIEPGAIPDLPSAPAPAP
jgi:hypothetical protein